MNKTEKELLQSLYGRTRACAGDTGKPAVNIHQDCKRDYKAALQLVDVGLAQSKPFEVCGSIVGITLIPNW